MLFTVEIKNGTSPESCEVEIYLDQEGLRDLQTQLSHLRRGPCSFFHQRRGRKAANERKAGRA